MATTTRDILNIVFRYQRPAIIFSVFVLAATLVYAFATKKYYTSTANLLVRLGQEQVGTITSGENNVYITRREQEINNESQILKSSDVVQAVAARLSGQDAITEDKDGIAKLLTDNIDVKTILDSDTLQVSFTFPDAEIARKVLSIYLEEFQKHHISAYRDTNEIDFLKKNVVDSRARYDAALGRLHEFVNEHKIYDNNQVAMLLQQYDRVRQVIIDATSDYEHNLKKKNRLEGILGSVPRYEEYSVVDARNTQLNKLQGRLNDALIERQSLRERYTETSRLVRDIDGEIALLRQMIGGEPESVTDTRDRRLSDTYASLNQTLLTLSAETSGQAARIAELQQRLGDIAAEIARTSGDAQEYDVLRKDADLAEATYEKYHKEYTASMIRNSAAQSDITNISVIEQPSLARSPAKPNLKKTMALSLLLLVFGNCALIIALHLTDSTFTTPEQAARALKLGVLGVLPRRVTAAGEPAISPSLPFPADLLREFQRIYLNIAHAGKDKVVLVASSQPSEGARTVGVNLARFAAAYPRKKVAFANFSPAPVTASLATPPAGTSFNHIVADGVTLFQYHPGNMADELRFDILKELTREFDQVFVTAPPVNSFPDLVLLRRHVDQIVYVVEAERTNRHSIAYCIDVLTGYGFENIGLLLNKRIFHIPRQIYGAV